MGASALPIIMFTLVWGGVAGCGYWVPLGPHKKLIQVGDSRILSYQLKLTKFGLTEWAVLVFFFT